MRTLALIPALGLCACASTQSVLSQPPVETFMVDQNPDEVAFCLATKNASTPLRRADGSQVVLIKNGYDAVSLAFTIIPDGAGSKVEYRRSFGTVGTRWRQCLGLTDD